MDDAIHSLPIIRPDVEKQNMPRVLKSIEIHSKKSTDR